MSAYYLTKITFQTTVRFMGRLACCVNFILNAILDVSSPSQEQLRLASLADLNLIRSEGPVSALTAKNLRAAALVKVGLERHFLRFWTFSARAFCLAVPA
jgi:hypothetical protein